MAKIMWTGPTRHRQRLQPRETHELQPGPMDAVIAEPSPRCGHKETRVQRPRAQLITPAVIGSQGLHGGGVQRHEARLVELRLGHGELPDSPVDVDTVEPN